MKRLLTLAAFLVSAIAGFGQTNVSISGTVTDQRSHEPLAGATVHIKGTTHEVVTNDKGEFHFLTGQHPPVVLVASYIGYQTLEWPTSETSDIHILLKQSSANLNDVIVSSGYATLSKRQYTGAGGREGPEAL